MTLEELNIKISADMSGLERGLKATTSQLTGFNQKLEKQTKGLGNLTRTSDTAAASLRTNLVAGITAIQGPLSHVGAIVTRLAGPAGFAALAGAGVFAFTKLARAATGLVLEVGELASELLSASEATGLSTDELQRWRHAAVQAGTSGDIVERAIARMVTQLDAGGDESKRFTTALDRLNVDLRDGTGGFRSMGQLLPEIFGALAGVTNETEKAALQTALFGRQQKDLAPLIGLSTTELRKYLDEAAVVGEESLKAADSARKAWERLKGEIAALRTEVASELAPALTKIADQIRADLVPELENIAKSFTKEDARELTRNLGEVLTLLVQLAKVANVASQAIRQVRPGGLAAAGDIPLPNWLERLDTDLTDFWTRRVPQTIGVALTGTQRMTAEWSQQVERSFEAAGAAGEGVFRTAAEAAEASGLIIRDALEDALEEGGEKGGKKAGEKMVTAIEARLARLRISESLAAIDTFFLDIDFGPDFKKLEEFMEGGRRTLQLQIEASNLPSIFGKATEFESDLVQQQQRDLADQIREGGDFVLDSLHILSSDFLNVGQKVAATLSSAVANISSFLPGIGPAVGGFISGIIDFVGGLFGPGETGKRNDQIRASINATLREMELLGQVDIGPVAQAAMDNLAVSLKDRGLSAANAIRAVTENFEFIEGLIENGVRGQALINAVLDKVRLDLEETEEGLSEIATTINNLPQGYKTTLARFNASLVDAARLLPGAPIVDGFGPPGGFPTLPATEMVARDAFHVDGDIVIVNEAGDSPEELVRKLETGVRERAVRGGVTILEATRVRSSGGR